MTDDVTVRRVCANDRRPRCIEALADVLIDCVEGGASVSFMLPAARASAPRRSGAASPRASRAGERALLVAEDARRHLRHGAAACSTCPRTSRTAPTSPRCWCTAAPAASGLGAALMRAAEAAARECGKTLLVLDTVTGGDAERLYQRLGWLRVGDVPNYALWPNGGLCATTFYYRDLAG